MVRFDARGFGGSPPGDGLLTMERIADDAAALLDHLQIAAATVCGLSMGGYAALAFARNHPTRLRGLVLADTKASADSDQARRVRAEQADKVRKEGTAAIVDAVLPKLLGKTSHEQRRKWWRACATSSWPIPRAASRTRWPRQCIPVPISVALIGEVRPKRIP